VTTNSLKPPKSTTKLSALHRTRSTKVAPKLPSEGLVEAAMGRRVRLEELRGACPAILLAILAAIFALTPVSAHAQDITGDWQASLKQGFSQLPLMLHIEGHIRCNDREAALCYQATLDNINLGLTNLPVTPAYRGPRGHRFLTFSVSALGASYSGTVNFPAMTEITGTWTQDGDSVPLDFTRPDGPMILPQYPLPFDAIHVSDFKEGKDPVTPGVPIKASEGWLKNFSLIIKNVSLKEITWVEVNLHVVDTANGTRQRPFSSSAVWELGQHPRYSRSNEEMPPGPGPPLSLPPGQELTVSFASQYDSIKESVEPLQPMSTIQKVLLTYGILFADGTMWSAGQYYRPDPAVHGRYLPISFSEFKEYAPPQ
jgi:hypothetical protein